MAKCSDELKVNSLTTEHKKEAKAAINYLKEAVSRIEKGISKLVDPLQKEALSEKEVTDSSLADDTGRAGDSEDDDNWRPGNSECFSDSSSNSETESDSFSESEQNDSTAEETDEVNEEDLTEN